MTSVSVSELNSNPCCCRSARSSAWFSMMPLCTIATCSPLMCGWALRSAGMPCVAQRVCAMPSGPSTGALIQQFLQLGDLADRADALQVRVVAANRDAGRVVAAVFEPSQPFHQNGDDVTFGDGSYYAAHVAFSSSCSSKTRGIKSNPKRAGDRPLPPTLREAGRTAPIPARRGRAPAGALGAKSRARQGLHGQLGLGLDRLLCRPLPVHAHLLRTRQRQLVVRRVLADHRTGADRGTVADRDRRDQRGVRTDEGTVADHGPVLVGAVVVAGDGAGTDVDAGADLGVADVAQVVDLGCRGRPRDFLISTKLPMCAPPTSSAPGRRRANGPILLPAPTLASSSTQFSRISTSSPMLHVAQHAVGADTHAGRPA